MRNTHSRTAAEYGILTGMESIIIRGGRPLRGEVCVEGAKNSALKLMAAALLAPGVSRLCNVPQIADVDVMTEVLSGLGAHIVRADHSIEVDATEVSGIEAPYEMVSRMRASISVLGPLVARCGRAHVAMPGGCNIGSRKIDMHVRGLEALGVRITADHGFIDAVTPCDGLRGAHVVLDFPSVGATENLLTTSTMARGRTVIENAACEPEIVDLVEFLNGMGARISGEGTSTIVIEGVHALHPFDHRVIGDRIEAGTFIVASALAGGSVTVKGFDPGHLEIFLAKNRAVRMLCCDSARWSPRATRGCSHACGYSDASASRFSHRHAGTVHGIDVDCRWQQHNYRKRVRESVHVCR